MQQLSLALLGPLEVRQRGQLTSFATRKALALLAYLVVESGQQPCEKITGLFWPGSDSERGRAALRRTLALPRQALPAAEDCLLITNQKLVESISSVIMPCILPLPILILIGSQVCFTGSGL